MLCEICKNKLTKFEKISKVNLMKCKICEHTITDIKVNSKYYKETYSDHYVDERGKNWMNNPNIELFQKIYDFIKEKNKGRIIDLGCGVGLFCKFLISKNKNLDITGVDLIKNKKFKNIKFINKEFFKYKTIKKYKFVISIAVIEHVPKVKKYFDYLKKISSKNSYFIILTINTNSILYFIANFLFKIGIKTPFIRLYDTHHLNHFSKKSLNKFIYKNKFKIVRRIDTPISMKQIDYPYNNVFTKYFLYIILYIILKIEKIFNMSWLQTVIFKKN